MMVGSRNIHTSKYDLLPVMDMTFRKDGEDYIDRVYVNTYEPFVGTAYTYNCNGYLGAVGYMPKCQNLGVLEMRDPAIHNTPDNAAYIVGGIPGITNFFHGGGGGSTTKYVGGEPYAEVPEPTTWMLLAMGLAAFLIATRLCHARRKKGGPRRDVLGRNWCRHWRIPRRGPRYW